jgi:hypothetical protein
MSKEALRKKAKEKKESEKVPEKGRETFLGILDSVVVGLQYHHGKATPGEEVYLEREPENTHDPRAVRVDTQDFDPLGYLPRRDAAWLAPLLDQGLVLGDARIPEDAVMTDQKAPLEIRIFASPKGKELLQLHSPCTTPEEGFRNLLFSAWQMGQSWEDPRMIREVGRKLRSLVDRSALPESHLYLRLFDGLEKRAEELGKQRLPEAFRKLTLQEPARWENYTIFWFSSPEKTLPSRVEELLLLEEALREGSAVLSEVSSEGSVPELRIANRGTRPLLLLEGELLQGGKQHRVLQVTLIVAPGEEQVIPVCCVEQGRWHHGGSSFKTASFAPPSVRRRSNLSRDPARASRAQGEVWEEVESLLVSRGVDSATNSLLEGYSRDGASLEAFQKELVPPPEALGCLVFRGKELLGMDVLESPQAFRALWPRLGEGYVLTPRREPGEESPDIPDRPDAEELQRKIGEALEKLYRDEEYPFRYLFEDVDFQGHGVFYGNRIRHLAAFPRE